MRHRRRRFLGPAVLAVLVGCTGVIHEPGPGGPASGARPGGPTMRPDGSFLCDPSGVASPAPLRRLSVLQYRNTVRDLFAGTPVDPLTGASAEIERVPVDDAGSSFRALDQRLSDQHVRAFYRVADRLATLATAGDATRQAIGGDCALEAAVSSACVDRFLDTFGMRAFRRPLTAEERARYHALNDGTRPPQEVFRALVFSLLMSPRFLYHVETEGAASRTPGVYALDAYELASRLSYHFWQSMPDDELLAAARDGALLTEEGYGAQAQRVFEDARTHEVVGTFYTEWFRLGSIGGFAPTAGFDTFAADTTIGEAGADHLAAMADEIRSLTDHFTWEVDGSFDDLLLTNLNFARSPHLAELYGVEPWDGTSAPSPLPPERAGLLTRVAFLVSGTHETHPIHRGATVRRRILCDELPQPDPTVLPDGALTPPPVTPDQTTRERYENKVQNEPCASCHRAMNPIGYVLESFDALGRFRTEERVIDELTGEVLNTLPVDSTSVPGIDRDDTREMSTAVELSRAIAESPRTDACFARQYFRFTFGRGESADDGCALERVRAVLAAGGSLREALLSIAMDPSFKTRRVQ